MSKLRDAAQQALEALESCREGDYTTGHVIHPSFDEKAVAEAEAALRAALAEQAEQEHQPWCASLTRLLLSNPPKPAPCNCKPKAEQEPVAWEWRWFDTSPYTVTSGQWSEWNRVDLDNALNEFRAYIANGLRYELRAIYTAPQPAKPAEQESVAWCDQYEDHIDGLRHYSDGGSREIPLYAAPQPRRRLTDEEIDNTTRKQVDDLLDHIYEYGTTAEGINYRVRAIARAIEAAVWGEKT